MARLPDRRGEILDELRDLVVGEPQVAVASLAQLLEQARLDEDRQVLAGGRTRDTRLAGELAGGPGTPVQQRQAHRDAAAIGEQPGEGRDRLGGRPGAVRAHERLLESETPTSASTPPAIASSGGVSPSVGHAMAIVIGGAR